MYDLSEIMKRAWAIYREAGSVCERRALAKGFIAERFRNALRGAWGEAKRARQPRTADAVLNEIFQIECAADFLTKADRARIEALHSELRSVPSPPTPRALSSAEIRDRIHARLGEMREGTTSGLSRDQWAELGALRDGLLSEVRTGI